MKKKTAFIIAVTIIYIIFSLFIFLNIQFMDSPEIIIKIEVSDINSEEAHLETTIDIDNPNSFDIIIKNLEITTITPDGFEVGRCKIKGRSIGANEKKIFSNNLCLALDGYSPELLTSKITGEVGANFLFIQKTIPLNIGVVTSIHSLIDSLAAPNIDALVEIVDITPEGLEIDASIDVYNPNTFEISIDNISANIETETEKIVGNVNLIGGIIKPNDNLIIKTNGTLLFEVMNSDNININLKGLARAKIAGYEKNLSFSIRSNIKVPDFEELLFSKNKQTVLSIKADEKLTLRGIVFEVILELNNTYKVDLEIKDMVCQVYMVKNEINYLIGENQEVDDILAKVENSDSSSCEVLVPYRNLIPIHGKNDWIMVSVSGYVAIKGVNQTAYLEIRGYQDLHLLS